VSSLLEEQREHKTQLEKEALTMLQSKEADQMQREQFAIREALDKAASSDKKAEALAEQLRELQSNSERRQAEYDRLVELRSQAEQRHDMLKQKYDDYVKTSKVELENAVKEAETQLRATGQRDVEGLLRQHETEVEDLRETFLREKESLLREIEMIRAKLAKRGEDASGDPLGAGSPRAIAQLQSRAQQAEERATKAEGSFREQELELMAAKEELRFYKTELQNRDAKTRSGLPAAPAPSTSASSLPQAIASAGPQ
jgi:hypothetical protein